MEEYRYSYLIMDVLFALIWLGLYWHRKDARSEMLALSIPLGLLGLVFTVPNADDWWKPLTVTGRLPGIEDFLFGFTTAGIAAVVYTELFAKHVRKERATRQWRELQLAKFWQLLFLAAVAFFTLHYGLGANTFVAMMTIMLIASLVGAVIRPDLIRVSILSGVFLLIIATAVYNVTDIFTPGWVESLWTFQNLPRVIVLHMPLEEILFYLLFGMIVGPMYEYLIHGKLVAMEAL